MSLETIEAESRKTARNAAKQKKTPFLVEQEDIDTWKASRSKLPFPALGSYKPKGFKLVDSLFCDSSGFGTESEPALTYRQLIDKLEAGKYYSLGDCGQFQVYVNVWEKIEKSA